MVTASLTFTHHPEGRVAACSLHDADTYGLSSSFSGYPSHTITYQDFHKQVHLKALRNVSWSTAFVMIKKPARKS